MEGTSKRDKRDLVGLLLAAAISLGLALWLPLSIVRDRQLGFSVLFASWFIFRGVRSLLRSR